MEAGQLLAKTAVIGIHVLRMDGAAHPLVRLQLTDSWLNPASGAKAR